MRKHLSILVVLLLAQSPNAYPQFIKSLSCRIGVASSNHSFKMWDGKTASSAARFTSIDVGMFAELITSDYISFIVGLEYQQRGTGDAVLVDQAYFEEARLVQWRIHYLGLPIIAQIHHRFDRLTPYLLGGITVNQQMYEVGETVLAEIFGVGLKVEGILSQTFFVDCRYSKDLTPAIVRGFSIGYEGYSDLVDVGLGIVL